MFITNLQPGDILKLTVQESATFYLVDEIKSSQFGKRYLAANALNLSTMKIETCMEAQIDIHIGGRWTIYRDGVDITLTR